MPREMYETLAEAIAAFDTDEARARYRARDIPRGHLVRDLDKRYRWDLYYAAAGYEITHGPGPSGLDLTTAHVDTALRRIVPDL
jgi:hypothetical protein